MRFDGSIVCSMMLEAEPQSDKEVNPDSHSRLGYRLTTERSVLSGSRLQKVDAI